MITNINTGTDPARIQSGEPCFFVSWNENKARKYAFFKAVSDMYKFKERLLKDEPKSPACSMVLSLMDQDYTYTEAVNMALQKHTITNKFFLEEELNIWV